jgi:hypothetical protein
VRLVGCPRGDPAGLTGPGEADLVGVDVRTSTKDAHRPDDVGAEQIEVPAVAGTARRQQLIRIVERRRQREIEAVVRAAVDYGWLTALKEPNGPRPVPVIEWTEDGKPRITTFTTTETAEAQRLAT